MRTLSRTTKLMAATSLLAMWSVAASAQTQLAANDAATGATTAAAGETEGLQDILVVGEKRESRLQEVPIAITAVSGSIMQQRNLNELNDLSGYVPGLNVAKSQGAERIITIRGIGYETGSNPNSQPGVAFHIDGVYIAHVASLAQDLLDIDRVEVLRGPQGTVFGETSTGGAINVITKKPVIGETSGSMSGSYGNYNYVRGNASLNLPISDVLAARFSGQYLRHDGYGYSTGVPNISKYRLDDADNIGGRGSLIFKPNDTFTALLEGQLFHANHAASLQKDVRDTSPGKRVVDQDYPGTYKTDTRMIYLTLSQELGDTIIAKSVSAYQYLNKNQTQESDRTANPALLDHLVRWKDRSKTFTEELSLSSQGPSMVDWTIGGFYLRQRALQDIYEISAPSIAATVLPDGTGVKFQTDSPYQHTSWAGYGQATAHLNDAFSLTAGARYSWDKVTAQPYQFFQYVTGRGAKSSAVTGKVSAEYKVTPDNLFYVSGSKGYKPTGVSFVSGSPFVPGSFSSGPQFVPPTFKKETVYAAEIGSKNDFFDHMLRLNASAYYYWYRNFQYTADDPVPFAGGTDNIPRAEVYGAEFEASLMPMTGLRFDGFVSLGKGTFKSNTLVIDAQTAAAIRNTTFAQLGYPAGYFYDARIEQAVADGRSNVNGKRLPKMPGLSGTFSTTYTTDLGAGELTMRGEVVYRGKFNYRIFAVAANDRVPAYTIANAYIEYAPNNQPWKVSFSANNIFDKAGLNSRFADPYGSGSTSVEYIAPRQVFGTVSVKF
jgi:iron complex outermembrane receptor protein